MRRIQRALRVALLILGMAGIVRWQLGFLAPEVGLDPTYHAWAGTALKSEAQFFFYLYHLDLFPIATNATIRADTRDEAIRLLYEEPKELKQDEWTTFRSGERGRTYLFFLNGWLKKGGLQASVRPTHFVAFTSALCAVFAAFWARRKTLPGAFLVVLLGSNPFQLYSTYAEENVFSWSITTMLFALAINLPLFEPGKSRVRKWYPWLAAGATGLLVGLIQNFRGEPIVALLSAAMVYLTMAELSRARRALLCAIMMVTFWTTGATTKAFLEHKFAVAQATVKEVGGIPYTGPREYNHEVWHALFCGLGDFDTKYGYEWNDIAAYQYALPILRERDPKNAALILYSGQPFSYDGTGKYPVFFSETPGYHEIIRDKVLGDIRRDPGWYFDILMRRTKRIFLETTPVGIAYGSTQLYVGGPLLCAAFLLALLGAVWANRSAMIKLLLFSTPLCISPLIIYSDRGMTYFSIMHIFGVWALGLVAFEGARTWLNRSPRRLFE
jgi:hypothetical protein